VVSIGPATGVLGAYDLPHIFSVPARRWRDRLGCWENTRPGAPPVPAHPHHRGAIVGEHARSSCQTRFAWDAPPPRGARHHRDAEAGSGEFSYSTPDHEPPPPKACYCRNRGPLQYSTMAVSFRWAQADRSRHGSELRTVTSGRRAGEPRCARTGECGLTAYSGRDVRRAPRALLSARDVAHSPVCVFEFTSVFVRGLAPDSPSTGLEDRRTLGRRRRRGTQHRERAPSPSKRERGIRVI